VSEWFPTPPPKPLKAPSAAKLVFGTLVPAVAIVGAIVWMSTIGHSGHKATAAVAPAAAPPAVSAAAQDRRRAFSECMRSLGGGSGFRARGRFGGGGPSKGFRDAFALCRSLLQTPPDRKSVV